VHSEPNLEVLRRRAKELLRAARTGDETALSRIRAGGRDVNLSAAQNAVAREAGFSGWTTARRAFESFAALIKPNEPRNPAPSEIGHLMGAIMGDPTTHEMSFLGSVLDDEFATDREVQLHRGTCPKCHARYEFETTILRGFADFIEAFCPRCRTSLGEFREDLSATILVRFVEQPAKAKGPRHSKPKGGGGAMS